MDVLEKAKEIEAKALAKSMSKEIAPITEIIQLPIWPEAIRGLPNVIARSALFNARRPNTPRELVDNLSISSVMGVDITYSGRELRQDDQTVLMQLMHLTQWQNLNDFAVFKPYSFLGSIRWPTTSHYYNKLFAVIKRLNFTEIVIKANSYVYCGSLIRYFAYLDGKTHEKLSEWKVGLELEIIKLFAGNAYSHIAWDQRTALSRPLAQWLQAYYASHKNPYPIKIETVRDLSGSRSGSLRKFKQTLKSALDELVSVGFLTSYHIDNQGLIHVKRAFD